MFKKTPLVITILFLLTLLLPDTGRSASKKNKKELILATARDGWPPFIIPADSSGEARGIMIDVLREATQCAGCTLKIAHYPEKRSLMNLQEGIVDVYTKAKEWVSQPNQFDWSDPIIISEDTLIFRKGDQARATQSLTGMDIGVVHGFTYPALKALFACGSLRRHNAHNTKSLLLMLSLGHVDAILTNRHVAQWVILNTPNLHEDDFSFAARPLDSAPFRFAFTKKKDHRTLIDIVNKEIKSMREDGRFQTILDRYGQNL